MVRATELTNLLKTIFGGTPEEVPRCLLPPIGCGKPIKEFRNAASEHEYEISGLCQKCQDRILHAWGSEPLEIGTADDDEFDPDEPPACFDGDHEDF